MPRSAQSCVCLWGCQQAQKGEAVFIPHFHLTYPWHGSSAWQADGDEYLSTLQQGDRQLGSMARSGLTKSGPLGVWEAKGNLPALASANLSSGCRGFGAMEAKKETLKKLISTPGGNASRNGKQA